MKSPETFYTENVSFYTKEVSRLKDRLALISFLRLAAFILMGFAAYRWFNTYDSIILLTVLAFLLLFILFIRIGFRLKDTKTLNEKLLFVNTNELAVLRQQSNRFDDAREFLSGDEVAADLDIFGPDSLFHLLNRTTTHHGKTELAALLQQPLLNPQQIAEQQKAVQQLSQQDKLRQLITAHGLLNEEKAGNLYAIESWLQLPPVLHGRMWVQIMRWLMPVYNVAALFYYLYTDHKGPLAIGILVTWGVIAVFLKQITNQHILLGKKQSILQQYAAILAHFSRVEAGDAALLQQRKQQAVTAYGAIKKLSSLAGMFDQRLNLLVLVFLNSFLMYDVHCLWSLESWKARNKDRFKDWIACTGAIEVLNSLAGFAYNFPAYQYPVLLRDSLVLEATGLAHPLIDATERVANDFVIGKKEKLILVTGSNMSGKTTFLRTLGVNLVLAQCGAPVCATYFAFTPLTIRTSIRVSDSLQEHTSYFMAELKRLRQIITHLQQSEVPTLVLIDEILRGTNSEDKTHGSEQFIKKLLQYNCLTLFATHDLMLSKLENDLPGQVNNYCFESIIRDDELLFDYRLQQGVAKNKNASFLMKKMDII